MEREALKKILRDKCISDESCEAAIDELLKSYGKDMPIHVIDDINGNFAQAESALLRIDPSGENPDPTEIYELLQWFRDKLLIHK